MSVLLKKTCFFALSKCKWAIANRSWEWNKLSSLQYWKIVGAPRRQRRDRAEGNRRVFPMRYDRYAWARFQGACDLVLFACGQRNTNITYGVSHLPNHPIPGAIDVFAPPYFPPIFPVWQQAILLNKLCYNDSLKSIFIRLKKAIKISMWKRMKF